MTDAFDTRRQSRRSFFRQGSTALAAGLVSAGAGASTLMMEDPAARQQLQDLQNRLAALEDREALRELFLAYNTLLQERAFAAVVELFTTDATVTIAGQQYHGRYDGIRRLFLDDYARERLDSQQCAFSRDHSQQADSLSIADDNRHASGCFHARVQWYRPLKSDSVLESMARLQGMDAGHYWENIRFDMQFSREAGQWKIRHLDYLHG